VIRKKRQSTIGTVIKHLMVQAVLAEAYHGGMNMDDISRRYFDKWFGGFGGGGGGVRQQRK
jgi:hypothetical protein